jgi:hypothetical protein
MNWTKLSVATTLAAALIASPATAYADPEPPPLPAGCAPDSSDPTCQSPPRQCRHVPPVLGVPPHTIRCTPIPPP